MENTDIVSQIMEISVNGGKSFFFFSLFFFLRGVGSWNIRFLS